LETAGHDYNLHSVIKDYITTVEHYRYFLATIVLLIG